MMRSFRKLTAFIGVLGAVAFASQAFAQMAPADILRGFGGIGAAGFGAGGPRPNPLGTGGSQMLPSAMPPQIERICKFEEPIGTLIDSVRFGESSERDSTIVNSPQNLQKLQIDRELREARKTGATGDDGPKIAYPLFQLYRPNVFERYVKSVTGQELCRFGFQTVFGGSAFFEPPPLAMAPDDYTLGPGDEVFIRLWGTIEQDFAAVIDRAGLIVIPKVGPVRLAGPRPGCKYLESGHS